MLHQQIAPKVETAKENGCISPQANGSLGFFCKVELTATVNPMEQNLKDGLGQFMWRQIVRLLADPHRPPPARPAGEGDWRANAT